MKTYYIREGEILKSVLFIPPLLKDEEIIPKDITTLGERCFSFINSVKTVVIPNNVTTIEKGAFYNNKTIEKVIIPPSVTLVKEGAFASCTSLKIVLYSSNTKFESYCFDHCEKLEKIICDDLEAKTFYFAEANRFAITFLIEQNKEYNIYMGMFAKEDFPTGDPHDKNAGHPLYFIQTIYGNVWYAETKDECLLAANYQDSKTSFSKFFNKTIELTGTITPMDVSFLTGIQYKDRDVFKEVFRGDDYTEWPTSGVLKFLNERFPRLYRRLVYAIDHQNEYNPLLSIDHGIRLSDCMPN